VAPASGVSGARADPVELHVTQAHEVHGVDAGPAADVEDRRRRGREVAAEQLDRPLALEQAPGRQALRLVAEVVVGDDVRVHGPQVPTRARAREAR